MKQFEKVPIKSPKVSAFDLSHEAKLTTEFGLLTPIINMEILPGDVVQLNYEALVRLMPTLAPVMHRMNVKAEFFFVPNRIIWDDWEKFITGGKTGTDVVNHPVFTGTWAQMEALTPNCSLADYLGIPYLDHAHETPDDPCHEVSQLPFRAYQRIYQDYYIDNNLDTPWEIPTSSANIAYTHADAVQLCTLRLRCWEKDYFTSALSTPQRGSDVELPLGTSARLKGTPKFADTSGPIGSSSPAGIFEINVVHGGTLQKEGEGEPIFFDDTVTNQAYADLSTATAASVREVRRAFALQRWFEKSMRVGYRYYEQLLGFFDEKAQDARLQRSEYIAGGKLPVQISEVLQTSETATTPQGTMAGHSISAGMFTGFKKKFHEHGILIGLLSITPRTGYCQGVPKIFSKLDKFDYYWPELAHIGEQPVYNKEIYMCNNDVDNETEFGYQPRYMEYRTMPDRVHGDFKASLDYWHMCRIFRSLPTLDSSFVHVNYQNDEFGRVFPVSEPADSYWKRIYIMGYFKIKAIRKVSQFGEPI